jgi:hypothetical protein
MREQVKSKFGAERFLINGADGNVIDGVYIPSQERHGSTSYDPHAISNVGTVLFCSPNAALYELLAQANKESSWVGFYTKLGFDVCLFNYRGYNCSSGVPAPDRVKSDGCAVARYLRHTRGVKRMVVHGESIGGMVACHVVRTCGADLLICDRTFASLDSVASRLLGWWAGLGLRFLGLWNTDVVSDFLSCSCPKVVLQDPADEIIADEASLKNGVATYLVLGDTLWPLRPLPRVYALAEVLDEPVPCIEEGGVLLAEAETASAPLTNDFIHHFAACVLDISKRATKAAKDKKSSKRGRGSRSERSDASSAIDSTTAGNIKKPSYGGNDQSTAPHNRSNGSPAAGVGGAERTVENETPLDDDEERDTEHVYPYDGDGEFVPSFDEDMSRSEEAEDWTMFESGLSAEEIEMMGIDRANRYSIESYCNRSIEDNNLDPIEKVWLSLSRTHGGTGNLLGQATLRRMDGVFCWVCAAIVWCSRATEDFAIPDAATSVTETVADLSKLIDGLCARELANDHAVLFVRRALIVIARRSKECSLGSAGGLANTAEAASRTGKGVSDLLIRSVAAMASSLAGSPSPRRAPSIVVNHSLSTNSEVQKDVASLANINVTALSGSDIGVGNLVPLHSGHNGWPSDSEIGMVRMFLDMHGFATNEFVSNNPNRGHRHHHHGRR